MQVKKYRKPGVLVCFLCLSLACFAQYTVRGGEGSPLKVLEDKLNRIEVWLVYGMEGVEISYTSASTAHKWYRYKNRILENEPISRSAQNGTTSTITGLSEGYGYFVEQESIPTSYCVWLIDYSKYRYTVNQLEATSSNPCSFVQLSGDQPIPNLVYINPGGIPATVNRSFDISYNTLEWSEADRNFHAKRIDLSVADPYKNNLLAAPLCDTGFQLTGDAFATHFGKGQTITTEVYPAVKVEAHADTTLILDDYPGGNSGGDGLSAPATVSFRAIANDPVAAFYLWTIYRTDDEEGVNNPLLRYTGEEVEYTFREAGKYKAVLEVSDRTATCSDVSVEYDIDVADSWIEIPNAFSPGTTPGVNDEFRVAYKSITRFKGWIFNRWGVQMFHWTDPAQGWDGKKGGKYVQPGVYFYVIEAEGSDGKKYKKSGDINILRSKTIQDERIE
ncbi:gliding motility-associated C-terminal domain-containing protein [Parabacteroides sp. PF5-6]|uniref:T9SS type B sorting domain-containing protein n=1 Tax=Parabacteroides sp. PF5-6 TaxID=1742403 RepID=UPI002405B05F|nr:gliding motility-associated C-terminal domain-containing protein [Parabacteroides sp. PF5-6]MDF9829420.1 gliding motility-associated-like protein [Parabacteroides sp. PF5-6]